MKPPFGLRLIADVTSTVSQWLHLGMGHRLPLPSRSQLPVNATVRTPTFPDQSYDLKVAVCAPCDVI
jgi:hypothetical protein